MSDKQQNTASDEGQAEEVTQKRVIPPQSSPTDISNWVDRPLNTPSGRVVVETNQTVDGEIIAE
ncbi:hypothetical protein KC968_03365 [Candidatus Saccharibacteria bacterium]|nr:hypothetical protein [Candidatus Saccharibacteria bacterium]